MVAIKDTYNRRKGKLEFHFHGSGLNRCTRRRTQINSSQHLERDVIGGWYSINSDAHPTAPHSRTVVPGTCQNVPLGLFDGAYQILASKTSNGAKRLDDCSRNWDKRARFRQLLGAPDRGGNRRSRLAFAKGYRDFHGGSRVINRRSKPYINLFERMGRKIRDIPRLRGIVFENVWANWS